MADLVEKDSLVSVIIIFFNAKKERFFEEAIESVLAQTYPHWELLLADDGSTDGSRAIAQRYVSEHRETIHYLEHENHQNLGMSAARNLGIRHAKGDYIAFLDADDIWLPHKLTEQVSLLEQYPEAAMVYGKTQFWFTWSEHNPIPHFSLTEEQSADPMAITSLQFDQLISPPTQLLHYLNNKNIYPCSCSMIMRCHIFEELGGFEEHFRDANEDMVFHSKIFLRYPVYVSSQCWDRYRIHPDSYWRTLWREGKAREAELAGRFNYLTWLEGYLLAQSISDPQILSALKTAFLRYRNPILYHFMERKKRLFRVVKRMTLKIIALF